MMLSRQLSQLLLPAMLGLVSLSSLAAEPAPRHDWPSYMGPNYDGADRSGVKLIEDFTKAKLLWESEERGIGFGKTTTGYPAVTPQFGKLPPSGAGSPIVAGGAVLLGYFLPSGDVTDAALEQKIEKDVRQRALIAADDVLIAIDAATGKTRWKQVYAGKGMNWSSGKRPRYSMTPAAADGRVFAMGTTGRVYTVDLATGKPLWESDIGPQHKNLEKARADALKARRLPKGNLPNCYGWLVVADQTVLAPDLGGGLIAFDVKDGRVQWHRSESLVSGYNMPAPVRVEGRSCLLTVNRTGDLRLLALDTGKALWTVPLKVLHLPPLVASKDHVLLFEPHPTYHPEGRKRSDVAQYGLLAGWRYDLRGAKRDWVLPPENIHELHLDHGPTRCTLLRDEIVHYARWGAAAGHAVMLVRESDGKVLAADKDGGKGTIFLWGNRLVSNSDLYHRPRPANAEIWQFYSNDPENFRALGGGWHVNGSAPVHVATGGYELPVLDAFADGLFFCRVIGGIRCYDLRAR